MKVWVAALAADEYSRLHAFHTREALDRWMVRTAREWWPDTHVDGYVGVSWDSFPTEELASNIFWAGAEDVWLQIDEVEVQS